MKNVKMTENTIQLLLLAALTLSSCAKGQRSQAAAGESGVSRTDTEFVDLGDQHIKAVNENNAGFQADRLRAVTVTVPSFGVRDAQLLDMLPRPDEASRRDSALIARLNAGEIFLLQAGEKGEVEMDDGTRLLVRFQVGELWIWKSAVE